MKQDEVLYKFDVVITPEPPRIMPDVNNFAEGTVIRREDGKFFEAKQIESKDQRDEGYLDWTRIISPTARANVAKAWLEIAEGNVQ